MATTSSHSDGGYYAIKGFTYQFDKSLLEVIANPTTSVQIEQIQDIAVNDYYIQVKYKEAQKYADSKIRDAVVQLLDLFINDKTNRFCLYCYFKDRTPKKVTLTKAELNSILGPMKSSYDNSNKKAFIKSFELVFSDDYEKQFANLIARIKEAFQLKSYEQAALYHALFRAHLLEVAIRKNQKTRTVSVPVLRTLAQNKERVVFDLAYCNYLKNDNYLNYLKKEFFTFKKVNLACRERLFLIEIDSIVKDPEIIQILVNIVSRYFKKDTSPAPYVCLLNVSDDRVRAVKQKLWDQGLFFADGTNFDGDRFRIGDLLADVHTGHSKVRLKLLSQSRLRDLASNKTIDESFAFAVSDNRWWQGSFEPFREFYLRNTKDIVKVIA